MSDLLMAVAWWLVLQILSLTVLPLAFRLFRWLPDRGYAFSKAMGVLLVTYLFWLLNSLGFLHNSAGGILFAMGTVALFSLWALRSRPGGADEESLGQWARNNIRLILTAELLFAAAFGFCRRFWLLGPGAGVLSRDYGHRKANGLGVHQCGGPL
jgi:hypothetical protein